MNFYNNRKVLLILSASGISFLGNGMHFIAMSWLAFELTSSPLAIGVLIAVGALPGIITAPFAGVFADRFNKKRIAVLTDLLRAVFILFIPIGLFFWKSMLVLYILTFLLAICSNFFHPALSGLIKENIKESNFIKVVSANSTLQQLGFILGPALGGVLVALFSIQIVLILDALTFIISAIFLLYLKTNPQSKIHESTDSEEKQKYSIWMDFKEGFYYMTENRLIFGLMIISFTGISVVHLFNSLLSDYTYNMGYGVKVYGIFDSFFAIGSVLTGVFIPYIGKKLSKKTLIPVSYVFVALGLVIIGLSNNLLLSSCGILVLGSAIMAEGILRKTLLLEKVDTKYIGRVESLSWILASSIAPLLALLGSFIASQIGSAQVLLAVSPILLVMAVISGKILLSNKKVTSLEERMPH